MKPRLIGLWRQLRDASWLGLLLVLLLGAAFLVFEIKAITDETGLSEDFRLELSFGLIVASLVLAVFDNLLPRKTGLLAVMAALFGLAAFLIAAPPVFEALEGDIWSFFCLALAGGLMMTCTVLLIRRSLA